jgi:crotonobetainyl-CoA:carnitine CoA-transferase CaiB-like acyl-CoA transferase
MFLGQGILMALLHRERTGEGQWVHTSLLEAMMNKLDFQGARYTMSGEVADQQGNDHPYQVPMGTYRSADGLVNVAAPSQRLWERMCMALEADDLLQNPDYRTGRDRAGRNAQLSTDLNTVLSAFSTAELVEKLNAAGVPCGPVNNIGEAFEDAQVKYLQMAKPAPHAELGALNLIRSPINLSAFPQPDAFDHAAPDPGQDSESVLREAGYSEERIAQFKDAGVI